jgi:hypothetical protein
LVFDGRWLLVRFETLRRNETVSAPTPLADMPAGNELREWARRHVERVRKLKRDAAAFVLGMIVLTAIWALIEWQDKGGFERFSDGGNPGDWNPWILYVALIWGFLLALDVLRTYFDRPTTEEEIDRELRRLTPHR